MASGTKLGSPQMPPQPPASKLRSFWDRVSDGLEVSELWGQFKSDARSSYRLYSREIPEQPGVSGQRHFWHVARALFWAVLLKLSPGRRVLLLIALLLLIFPLASFDYGNLNITTADFRFGAGLLLLVLLVLEVADRVTMKRDLEIAREIQMWLVPAKPPAVPGLEVAFVNRPANTVAGDYYDVFPRAGSNAEPDILLAIADVAGKSLPAALLMATFQASLKTLSASPCSLLDLVAGLNRYACAHSREGLRFTTAFLAEFAPALGVLTFVNAGHNAPILLRAGGGIERLERGGIPLGILSDAPYESGSLTLEKGDLLIIFTDGVVEAVNDRDEEFGEERLLATVLPLRGEQAEVVVRRVMAQVETFVGMAHQHDDITCFVVRRV